MSLIDKFRMVSNFPKDGIEFIDITPVLNDKDAFKDAIDFLAYGVKQLSPNVDVIVGTEARGFILGSAVAYKLGVRFVPVRKPGKLPYASIKDTYDLEYGSDTLEMHVDAIKSGDNVVILDDLLATGGTVSCTANLIRRLCGNVNGAVFLIRLKELNGKDVLKDNDVLVYSVIDI